MRSVKAFSLQRILCGSFVTLFCAAMIGCLHAGDEQWGREFFNPVAGQPGLSLPAVGAMAIAPDGKLIYGGTSLTSDQGPAQVVALSNSQRTRLAAPAGLAGIYAIAIDGTNIYVGGDFKGLSGYAVTNLAQWDGATGWLSVGGSVSGGPVRALAIKDGSLYVGGGFTNAGGISVNAIARWDGTNWDGLAGGLHPTSSGGNRPAPIPAVRALQFVGDRLYVGGNFDTAGGIVATNIAEFSSGTWKPLISGTNNGVAGGSGVIEVHALAANTNGELIVGGTFNQAGDVPANFVAKWTGSQWQALGLGLNRPSDGSVDSLYCQGNDIYAGGRFVMLDGVWTDAYHYGFARWDGTNWVTLAVMTEEGVLNNATLVTGDGTNVFAATPLISPVTLSPPQIKGISIIKGHDNDWSVLGGGIAVSPDVHTVTTTGAKIQTTVPGNGGSSILAEWNGNTWVAAPALQGSIEKILYNDGITYAVGNFTPSTYEPPLFGIAGWNGTNWFNLADGLPSAGLSIATNGVNIIAGHQTGIRQWNGTAWSDIGNGLPGEVRAIAVDGNTIFAGGIFSTNGLTNIAQWSGGSWEPLGSGLNAAVRALALIDHKLYAGGDFTLADGKTANGIAVWDGASWSELGGGISTGIYGTTVHAIEPDGAGGLFVGGEFQQAGGMPANFIAHWNGEAWETLGSGLDGPVFALTTQGEDLFAVGNFATAGSHASWRIARYHLGDLSLAALGVANDGTFSLEARGLFSKQYILQESLDLNTWNDIATNTFVPPRAQLSVPAGSGARFYRLVTP
jgi:hypothetical protein